MKKIFIYISIVASLIGCNNDLETEGLSRITYYPTFELTGGDFMLYTVGEPYTEPGIKVTEEGTDIPFTTTGSVDTSKPGFYQISYSAVNKDGFPGTATRTVVVLEENLPELDIEGAWTSNTNAFSGASIGQTLTITKVADGVYAATDSYAHPDVEVPIRFLINADGTATLEEIPNSAFGVPMTGKITFNVAAGQSVKYPDGTTGVSPVAADMVIAVLLVDEPNTYRLKTWLKD
jgi:uncharacterized lipoprotein NlpE involved in copper resistance